MEKYISPQDFISQTVSKKYDVDGVAGVQCVDAIKKFTQMVYGKHDFNCGKCGYAYGLWTNFATNGVSKYFKKVPFSQAQKGDWIIWNWKSKPCPTSHVAMFVSKNGNTVNAYGQNQLIGTTNPAFNTRAISTSGILGVLRPLIYTKQYETGFYTTLYEKYLRTSPYVVNNNYVLVGNTTLAMRSGLTSSDPRAKAKVKKGITITIKEIHTDASGRIWGKSINGWIVLQNADGTPQCQKA